MNEVSSDEAKTYLPALLRRVEAGERILITRHGRPVAELVPTSPEDGTEVHDAIRALYIFGDGRYLGADISIRELINEGRP